MQETITVNILGDKGRIQYFIRLILLLLIGSAYLFGF